MREKKKEALNSQIITKKEANTKQSISHKEKQKKKGEGKAKQRRKRRKKNWIENEKENKQVKQ